MSEGSNTPADVIDESLDDAAEAASEIQDAIEEAAAEVEEVAAEAIEEVAEEVDAAVSEVAEEVARETGLTEEAVRALIREELDARNPAPVESEPVVVTTTTETVEVPADTPPATVDEAPAEPHWFFRSLGRR